MNHASTDVNNDGVITDDYDIEYGDSSDPMGLDSSYKRFNAVHRLEMGWFHSANVATNPSGAFTLTSASVVGSTPSAVGLVRLTRPSMSDSYWVSLRTAVGPYDSTLPSGWANVVYIHRWASGNTKLITRLSAGQTYNDLANSVSVYVSSINTTSNTASIVVDVCTLAAPSLAVSPVAMADCGSTTTTGLTLNLTNNNVGCGPVAFTTEMTNLPAAWNVNSFPSCVVISVIIVPDKWPTEITWDVRHLCACVVAALVTH